MYGSGRITDVIDNLKKNHNVDNVSTLPAQDKLSALCHSLLLTPDELDELIANNSPVLRTVKGHAFEAYFDELMESIGVSSFAVGGDSAVDRIVHDHNLQLKTPNAAGTKGDLVQYKTHKTHGPKSEQESMDYYHHIDHFSEFLVGLISYDPLNIVILNKSEFPRHTADINRILSPFTINWKTHASLNAWDRIDISEAPSTDRLKPNENELLPKTSRILDMTSDVIINTILSEENFRIWDMSIRGFAREVVFSKYISERSILATRPEDTGRERANKSDHALISTTDNRYRFFQMKGASVNNCKFKGSDSIVATETQLTRGRVNDHPTQSRLYHYTDFDFLIIGLDPSLTTMFDQEIDGREPSFDWRFFCIPLDNLKHHHKFNNRLKSLQSFKYTDLDQFEINAAWYNQWKLE